MRALKNWTSVNEPAAGEVGVDHISHPVKILCGIAVLGVIVHIIIDIIWPIAKPITSIEQFKPLLVVTEVAPFPYDGKPAFIEFENRSDADFPLAGYVVGTGSDPGFPIGEDQDQIPRGGRLLLLLDDKNDEPMKDGESLIIMHGPSSLAELWEPAMGQLVVRSKKGNPVTCVVWGTPLAKKDLIPGIEKLWQPGWFVHLHDSFGLYELGTAIAPGASIGLYPDSPTNLPADWTVYTTPTPLQKNPVPQPSTFTTPDGARVDSAHFAIAWKGRRHDKSYDYELVDFEGTIVEEGKVDTPLYERNTWLKPGAYFFRVRVTDDSVGQSSNSVGGLLSFFTTLVCTSDKVTLEMEHFIQRKDTPLVCLDGCQPETDTSTDQHWNKAHLNTGAHGAQYCARACVAMMVSHYHNINGQNKTLSQDRIALFTDEELCSIVPTPDGCYDHCYWRDDLGVPEGDLAHNEPVYCNEPNSESPYCLPVTKTLEWALDEKVEFFKSNDGVFADIEKWIDAGRPIIARLKDVSHVIAINGYCYSSDGDKGVVIHDPSMTSPENIVFDHDHYKGFWVGPAAAPSPLFDGDFSDSDGDGLTDFDEKIRFATKSMNKDTDNDGVDDLNDIREYVFSHDGEWEKSGTACTVTFASGEIAYFNRIADFDGDSLRKEVDSDNDNDGCLDGVEDSNGNGVFELDTGESHNFVKDCTPCSILPPGCRCR